jgi:hypothetical protein
MAGDNGLFWGLALCGTAVLGGLTMMAMAVVTIVIERIKDKT